MPKVLWKNLHLCFPSNLAKCYFPAYLAPSSSGDPENSEHPNRPSIVLINNFNLLYHDDDHHLAASTDGQLSKRLVDIHSASTANFATSSSAKSSYEPDDSHDISHELSAAFASRRFFFSSPGQSNAITDSSDTRSREFSDNYDNATIKTTKKNYNTAVTTRLLSGGTAVKQHVYSPDPLTDFRRSMQEMIDAAIVAGDLTHPEDGYDFLNELLLSYLSLNPTDTHKFVIRAFSDILVTLLSEELPI